MADTVDGYAVNYVYLYALPTTGPDPESGVSNWTGELTTGKLYSIGDYAWADVYYSQPAAAKSAVGERAQKPERSPQEIMEAIIEAYK